MRIDQASPYVREEDGELLGYLVPVDEGFVPTTVFGAALAGPGSLAEGESVLAESGLVSLSEAWLLRREDGEQVDVAVISAYAGSVLVVETEFGFFGPDNPRHTIEAADAERLTRRR